MQFSLLRALSVVILLLLTIPQPVSAQSAASQTFDNAGNATQEQSGDNSRQEGNTNAFLALSDPSTMWASIAVTVGLFLYGARPWQRRRELR